MKNKVDVFIFTLCASMLILGVVLLLVGASLTNSVPDFRYHYFSHSSDFSYSLTIIYMGNGCNISLFSIIGLSLVALSIVVLFLYLFIFRDIRIERFLVRTNKSNRLFRRPNKAAKYIFKLRKKKDEQVIKVFHFSYDEIIDELQCLTKIFNDKEIKGKPVNDYIVINCFRKFDSKNSEIYYIEKVKK